MKNRVPSSKTIAKLKAHEKVTHKELLVVARLTTRYERSARKGIKGKEARDSLSKETYKHLRAAYRSNMKIGLAMIRILKKTQ